MRIRKTVLATALLALLAVAAVMVAGAVSPGTPQARGRRPGRAHGDGQRAEQDLHHEPAPGAHSLHRLLRLREQRRYGLPAGAGGGRQAGRRAGGGRRDDHAERLRRRGLRRLRDDLHLRPGGQQERRAALQHRRQDQGGAEVPVDVRARLGAGRAAAPEPMLGPLRLVVAQETDVDQVADGHYMVKWVSRVSLRGAVADWKVKMYGLKRRTASARPTRSTAGRTTRARRPAATGSRGSTPRPRRPGAACRSSCASARSTAAPATTATAPTTRALALKGYRIKLVGATGKYAIIGSRTIRNRTTILLANKLMGSELTARYYPLKLVGPTEVRADAQVHRPHHQDRPAAQVSRQVFAGRDRP